MTLDLCAAATVDIERQKKKILGVIMDERLEITHEKKHWVSATTHVPFFIGFYHIWAAVKRFGAVSVHNHLCLHCCQQTT